MSIQGKKKEIIKYSKLLSKKNLSPVRSGNISMRYNKNGIEGFLITPSGMKNDSLKIENIVFMDMDGRTHNAKYNASSEWRFHLDIYRKKNTKAIVHCHSKYAVVLACFRKKIPAFHYMVALVGGHNIKCSKYATFGTKKLSENILIALNGRNACLMENHGQLTIGDSLDGAFELAEEVEILSELYFNSMLVGKPFILNNKQINEVLVKMKNYKN